MFDYKFLLTAYHGTGVKKYVSRVLIVGVSEMLRFLKRLCFILALTVYGATSAFADSPIYKLYVDGLACPFCAYGVEKQVGGLDNVKSVDVLIDEGIVSVTMDSGKTLDKAAAKRAVSDAGFTLRKFERVKAK